jgi:aspartate 1-decarboxylase
MMLTMLKGKIHRATVTDANLEYVGSVTIDSTLLEASGILPHEAVDILDITNGARITTYALAGPPGSGMICVNGAAAHLVHKGDLVILCAYAQMEPAEAEVFEPTVVLVDEANHIAQVSKYRAGLLVGTS